MMRDFIDPPLVVESCHSFLTSGEIVVEEDGLSRRSSAKRFADMGNLTECLVSFHVRAGHHAIRTTFA